MNDMQGMQQNYQPQGGPVPFDNQQQMQQPQQFGQMPNPADFGKPQGNQQNFSNLNVEPNNLTGWQLLGKVAIGLVLWGIISVLLFVVISFVGTMFVEALNQTTDFISPNPLLPLILLFIGFLSTFIGNMSVAGVYNLFFGQKYYDSSKMFGFLLLTNGLLFFILAPIYLVFSKNIETLFFILGFHVLFSVFVSANQIEFLANPNYSGSALMGNTVGFAIAILIYSLFYKTSGTTSVQTKMYLFMLLPSVLAYTLIPLGAGIWEKVYYKFYEMWNNAFYIPSISEVVAEQVEENNGQVQYEDDQTNVDIG